MSMLGSPFHFTMTHGVRPLSLRSSAHVSACQAARGRSFGERLSKRQIDLLRIATVVHAADGWTRRFRSMNGHREPLVDIEVLDPDFWNGSGMMDRLKACVDFLSGDDDWSFRFRPSPDSRHDQQLPLLRIDDQSPVVAPYSGGLDSAAGLAIRLAAEPGRSFIPVTLGHGRPRGRLVRRQVRMLVDRDLATGSDLRPFLFDVSIHNAQIKHDYGQTPREVTHRCRPLLYMTMAGLVATTSGTDSVEVYESGVGSVNLPLAGGPADFRTTRSAHPRFLRLLADVVGHASQTGIRYVLPFSNSTKAEMVGRVRQLGLEGLARDSVSCIIFPINKLRSGGRQCGQCPACVYRRQAMSVAGIPENSDAYTVDLLSPPTDELRDDHLRSIRAFHQQVGRLDALDGGRVPDFFLRYLKATGVASTDEEIMRCVEVHRRYRREWVTLNDDARRRGVPWGTLARPRAFATGATP